MTVHKSKGLEFDVVYIADAATELWQTKRSSKPKLKMPVNLAISPAADDDDDLTRLVYVATTRARDQLKILYPKEDDNGKALEALRTTTSIEPTVATMGTIEPESLSIAARVGWQDKLFVPDSAELKTMLEERLSNYKMSVTHLINFLDVENGGPKKFFYQNLLLFPTAKTLPLVFGNAIHHALEVAHKFFSREGELMDINELINAASVLIKNERLSDTAEAKLLDKAETVLKNYYMRSQTEFKNKWLAEFNFKNQNIVIGKASITGKIDALIQDDNSTIVKDYKTGKVLHSWAGSLDSGQKRKAHNYKQQIAFYKLLVDGSTIGRNKPMSKGVMDFVEGKEKSQLEYSPSPQELERLKHLIDVVWE